MGPPSISQCLVLTPLNFSTSEFLFSEMPANLKNQIALIFYVNMKEH